MNITPLENSDPVIDLPDIPSQNYSDITITRIPVRDGQPLWNVSAFGEGGTTYNIPCLDEAAMREAVRLFRSHSKEHGMIQR
jgi:hypothetical protein